MTLIAGIIIGVVAMWLRERALAKPSPLLRLPASELRTMLERATAASHEAHARWIQQRLLAHSTRAREDGDTYYRLLDEVVMLRDALRIAEAREVETLRQGAYR